MLLALGGCGVLPRTSTGDELMEAVLIREDPFGDCAIVDEPVTIFKDTGGPNDPPGLLTRDSFRDPDARAAAAAIEVSFRKHVWRTEEQTHFGDHKACMMHVSRPAYSGTFAFIEYSNPGGAIGAYAFQKSGTRWRVIEHKQLGYW
jgi:hypothetical protein